MTWRETTTTFLNNPEYNQIKAIALIVILGGGAFFVSKFVGDPVSSQAGSILEATRNTETLGSGVTVETVTELNKEVERLNNIRTSDAWYVFEGRKERAEESLMQTLETRSEVIGDLAAQGNLASVEDLAITHEVVALLPEEAQQELEAPDTVTGEMYTEHVDDFENPENSYFRSFVVTDEGDRYDILPTKEVGFARATVTVSGKISGSTIIGDPVPTQIKSTIQKHTHAGEDVKMAMPGGEPVGEGEAVATNKIAVFLVRYEDTGDVFFTPEEADEIFFDSSFDEFYKEQSYHNLDFYGDVYGWVTIPRESDPWSVDLWGGELDEYLIENDIDLSSYDHLVVYNDGTMGFDGFSSIGSVNIELGGEEYTISYAQVQSIDSTYGEQYYYYGEYPFPFSKLDYIVSHEMGHSIGLWHANGLDCETKSYHSYSDKCEHVEYGNKFDVMGGAYALHFNGWYKDALGWLSPSEVQIIDKTGDYTIGVLEDSEGAIKYAQVRSSNPSEESIIYTVEYRKAIGFDGHLANDLVASNQAGLFINRMYHLDAYVYGADGDEENYYTRLLDLQPTGAAWYTDVQRVTLRDDKIFYDEANNIQIGPIVSISPTSITFHVDMPSTACVRKKPRVKLDPDEEYVVDEIDDAYVRVVNTDNAFCGDSPEFSYTVDASSMGLIGEINDFYDTERIRVDSFNDLKISFDDGAVGAEEVLPGAYPIVVTATNLTSGMTSDPFTFNLTVE